MSDKWIEREILRGIQGLIALRLPGAPAEDAVNKTCDIWLAAAGRRTQSWQQVDAPRIRRAFTALFACARQWPTPAEFLAALPARPEPQLLPPPKMSEAELEKNRARIAALIDQIFNRHKTGD